ncbi:putative disease resistance protein RGA3-like protein [Corchorus olitorius]|uniref:Disease resistance protein RGA3-like protein n=1 Tax=Corchorus olitorius TaxID=93759 RepID=A0A1R3GHB9_9ROSI|nr:putative disease resistance protein RGA3-like protein [Corchorus olitorius]
MAEIIVSPLLQAVLEDAEEQQLADRALRIWLTELKEIAYEMEDLLDEFTPEAIQFRNQGNGLAEQWNTVSCVERINTHGFPFFRILVEFQQERRIPLFDQTDTRQMSQVAKHAMLPFSSSSGATELQ